MCIMQISTFKIHCYNNIVYIVDDSMKEITHVSENPVVDKT